MARNGPDFERAFSKQLSLWFSGGESDAIFWRSTTSGARATTRAKAGKKTAGQYGDIAATDFSGMEFIQLLIIELKKGYNDQTPTNMIDSRSSKYAEWVAKTVNSAGLADAAAWAIVHQRTQRQPVMWLPTDFCQSLEEHGGLDLHGASITFHCDVDRREELPFVTGFALEHFFQTRPKKIVDCLRTWKRITKIEEAHKKGKR